MSDSAGINEYYHVVVRRGEMERKRNAINLKPFVWEIRHKETTLLLGSSVEAFATLC
jgi:hypothetical protein